MKRFVLAGMLAFSAIAAADFLHAQDSTSEPPGNAAPMAAKAPITDPAMVQEHYQKVLREPAYQESTSLDANVDLRSWVYRWFARIGQDFEHFSYGKQMPRFTSMLISVFVALSIAGLIYTLVRLTRRGGGWVRTEAQEASSPRIFRQPESYDAEVRRAVEAKDWHEAWLASWRQFLARLEHGRMVEADRSRTNREYLAQLRTQPLPVSAETLLPEIVEAYDQFIYGHKPIGEPDWNDFQHQVNEAALMLHLLRPAEPLPSKHVSA